MTRRRGNECGRLIPKPVVSRRQILSGMAATLGLVGCDRFDAMSWVTREKFDVDRRFRDSIDELAPPLPPTLRNASVWSAFFISDLHFFNDEGNLNIEREVGRYLIDEPVDLLFQLGDVADAGWPIEYDTAAETLDRLGIPTYHLMGNHDVYHDGWTSYRDYFGPSVYTLRVGEVLFICIDVAGATLGGLQRPWLEEQLVAAAAEHIVLLGHYPLWNPNDEGFSLMGSSQEVYDILDLMRRYDVAAHISGHTHRWAYTDFDGVGLYTVSSMKEAAPNRCGLRIDYNHGELSFTCIPLGEGQ